MNFCDPCETCETCLKRQQCLFDLGDRMNIGSKQPSGETPPPVRKDENPVYPFVTRNPGN